MRATTLLATGIESREQLDEFFEKIQRPAGWSFHPHDSPLGFFIIGECDSTEVAEGWRTILKSAKLSGWDISEKIRILGTWMVNPPELASIREHVARPKSWEPTYIQQDDHRWFVCFDVEVANYNYRDWLNLHYGIRIAMSRAEGILA